MSVQAIVAAREPVAAAGEGADEVVCVAVDPARGSSGPLRAAIEDGAASGHEWLWVLEDTLPQPGALATLLDWAAAHADRSPAVLAARVQDAAGRLHFGREWPDYGDIDAVVAGADLRALPLRAASFHGLLLSTAAVRCAGVPLVGDAGWRADWEYTGRLLRDHEGWLVPASVVRLTPGFTPAAREAELRNALWVARSDAWGPRERFDRHVQWAVAAARMSRRGEALRALRAGLRRRPR